MTEKTKSLEPSPKQEGSSASRSHTSTNFDVATVQDAVGNLVIQRAVRESDENRVRSDTASNFPAAYTRDGQTHFSPGVAHHPRRKTIDAHEAVHRAQFARGQQGQTPAPPSLLEEEAQQGAQDPNFVPQLAAPAGVRLFSPDTDPLGLDIGRFGEQEWRDLKTVKPGIGQEPRSEITFTPKETQEVQDLDYVFSATAKGQRGSIESKTLLHLHRERGDPFRKAVPTNPELNLVGDPKDVKIYPVTISYSRTISYSDEYGRKLDVELRSNVWFSEAAWEAAMATQPALTLDALEQLQGSAGHMQIRISGEGDLAHLIEQDYQAMPDKIKSVMLKGAYTISYLNFASVDGNSLRFLGGDIAAALKNTQGAFPIHLSEQPGNFVYLNCTAGQQYDAIRAYLESRDAVSVAKWRVQIEESLKNPAVAVSGPVQAGTGTVDLSKVKEDEPTWLDKLLQKIDEFWDSLPAWLRGTLKAVGIAIAAVAAVFAVAFIIVKVAAVAGVTLAIGKVALAIGGTLLTLSFLKSLYERYLESVVTGSGNFFSIIAIALLDALGISGIIEGSTNESLLSGTPLNLSEEERWERGVGGALQVILIVLGVRSYVRSRTAPADVVPEPPKAPPSPTAPEAPATGAPQPAVPEAPPPAPQPAAPAAPAPAGAARYNPAARTGTELVGDIDPIPRVGETVAEAQARALSAVDYIYTALGERPPRIDMAANDAANPAAHAVQRHGPGVTLERAGAPAGTRTVEGRILGDPPWNQPGEGGQQNYSFRWSDESTMNRTINDYLRANWERIRSDLAMNMEHDATFNASNRIGEGFYNARMFQPGAAANPVPTYATTSWATIVIRIVPGNPPGFYVHTAFPTINFVGGNIILE